MENIKINILNYKYSLIGNFLKLINTIKKFSAINEFKNFKKKMVPIQNIANNGFVYQLIGEEYSIYIQNDRFDIVLKQITKNDYKKIIDILAKLKGFILGNTILRVAINFSSFFKNIDNKYLERIKEGIEIVPKGNTHEFGLYWNNLSEHNGKTLNNIINIQIGKVQNKDSFEIEDAIIFSADINTAININKSIETTEIEPLFAVMFDSLMMEINNINSALGENV